MTDTPSPALSDDELRETLDLLSTVLASVSDRVDTQTEVLDRLNKTATEARQAAFAAKAHTDPKRYGEMVGIALADHIGATLNRLGATGVELSKAADRAEKSLAKVEEDQSGVYRVMRERERPGGAKPATTDAVCAVRRETGGCAAIAGRSLGGVGSLGCN